MPEYVYALHDFLPENDDEVPFRAGERIEVIEKDEAYGDGWWQGRNLAGRVGLFPQTYTTSAPPSIDPNASVTDSSRNLAPNTSLQPLNEESETESPSAGASTAAPAIYLNGHDANGNTPHNLKEGEVMKATMTDVQKAIEQLGSTRGGGDEDVDGARSFSFASSRDDRDTEGETDETDFDMTDEDPDHPQGEGWHKGARRKLAEKARRAVEEAEKLEMIMGGLGSSGRARTIAPPIEVEVSDESEGEEENEDYTRTSGFSRRYSHISEEDEGALDTDADQKGAPIESTEIRATSRTAGEESNTQISVPERDESELPTATAMRTTFTSSPGPREKVSSRHTSLTASDTVPSSPPPSVGAVAEFKRTNSPFRDAMIPSSSPTASLKATSTHTSIASAVSGKTASLIGASSSTTPPMTTASLQSTLTEERAAKGEKEKAHPSEWSVDEVIDWLKSKGFGEDVCEKFTEQEITGDVLLELDVNLLKTEIGIPAFGKRMRIANAITDLRRPPSITYSDRPEMPSPSSPFTHPPQSPSALVHSGTSNHSRSQSQAYSHHSFPGTSTRNSVYGMTSHAQASLLSPENAPHSSDFVESPGTMTGQIQAYAQDDSAVGLGSTKATKSRPSQLIISPNTKSLNAKAVSDIIEGEAEERAALSESEALPQASVTRRLFGRSQDPGHSGKDSPRTASSKGSHSPTPGGKGKESTSSGPVPRHARGKKSIDANEGSSRLSFFGGTLGKSSRKAPPRYSIVDESTSEKGSAFHLPRLGVSTRKSSGHSSANGRPTTPVGSVANTSPRDSREKGKESKESTNPTLLRKRTSSFPMHNDSSNKPTNAVSKLVGPVKPGESILNQIGEPDHAGWMRKKGERYNSWKLRYFVLKGQHLYYLRNDSPAETRIKGYINIIGYKVTVDENVNPGRYGFRIDHDNDKSHFFCSDEKSLVRDWMKAIMKATIGRDYSKPVISSCNIPTISLMVAQAMNPSPRPPSPTARDATQKALRRENPNQLSSRDARVLMGLPSNNEGQEEQRGRVDSFFTNQTISSRDVEPSEYKSNAPPRPARRLSLAPNTTGAASDDNLITWANSHLPSSLQITDNGRSICGGLHLLRIAEAIKGRPSSPPVPDSAFPRDPADDKLDGLFRLFDFLLDNDVKMGSVSINDIRQGKREKILQLLKALKMWEDKRRALAQSIGNGSVQAGGFIAPVAIGIGSAWSGT